METIPSVHTHLSFYNRGQLGSPVKTVDISDIYDTIKSDESLQKVCDFIVRKHRPGIETNFKKIDKKPYQDQKKKYLDGVCFSGDIDRSSKPSFRHNGRINLDIDENTKEELRLLRRLVKGGHFPFVEACGRSISGGINGSLWVNALVEIPEERQYNYDKLEDLHKRYHRAISQVFANILIVDLEYTGTFKTDQTLIKIAPEELHLLGIKSGHQLNIKVGAAKDLKRIRYITHDHDLYVVKAKPVQYEDLLKNEAYCQQKEEVRNMESKTWSIVATDHFDWCHKFAVQHEYHYEAGQKQNYLAMFSIGANLIGIPEEETRTYILGNIHPKEDGDFIRYPYKNYKESFGVLKHKVQMSQQTFKPMVIEADTFLTFDKYVEDSKDFPKLLDRICTEDRSMLYMPTGSGKTVSTISSIYDRLKAQFPKKTFIFLAPLTAITEQTAEKARKEFNKNLQVICEGATSHHSALFEDTICTVKSFVDWSENLHEEDQLKDVILVFDELHELITASGYQQLHTMPYLFDQVFKVVGLTATPLTPLITDFGFVPIKCERIQNPAVNIACKRITQDQLYKTITAFGNAHRTSKTLYFYNDKKKIERLAKASKRRGLKTDYFHADLKRDKAQTYRHLIEEGTLPKGIDHLFSTKILGFGTSFKDLDQIVYVTNNRTKDFLEFIQSYARLREDQINVTLIIIEPKNESEGKYRQYDFDPEQYHSKLTDYQKKADAFNVFDRAAVTIEGVEPFKNNLPEEVNRLVKYNKLNGQYFVDRLQLFNQQYQQITRSISAEDFLHFMKMIPNVTIEEITEETIISIEDQQIIDEVEQQYKEEETQDIEALKVLLTDQRDQVFKYIYDETDDTTLKAKIKDHLPLISEHLKHEATELIDRRFKYTVNVVRRYIRLKNDYKNRIDTTQLIEYCFLTNYNWHRKLRQLYSLDNVERIESGADINEIVTTEAKGREKVKVTMAHQQMIQYFTNIKGQHHTASDLFDLVKEKDWFTFLNLNQKTWTEEVKMFFHIERRRTKQERLICFGDRHQLSDLLKGDILRNVCSKKKVA